ncbi:MAG: hypothetical protein ACI304_07370 [Lepagella sp.]
MYQSLENELPHFVQFDNYESQIQAIIKMIATRKMKSVGIFVPNNERVLSLMKSFTEHKFVCEFKYNAGLNDNRNRDDLDFSSDKPK